MVVQIGEKFVLSRDLFVVFKVVVYQLLGCEFREFRLHRDWSPLEVWDSLEIL
jgi:hypothetical protein